jgi:predicted metal-dependent peptidase
MNKEQYRAMPATDKIMRFKNRVYTQSPFIAYLLAKTVWIPDDKVPTACIYADGRVLYSEKFVNSLEDAEGMGVSAHEVLHVACGHHANVYPDFRLGNIAEDLKINDMLRTDGFTLPSGMYTPEQHKFVLLDCQVTIADIHLKSTMEIYNELVKAIEKRSKDNSSSNGKSKHKQDPNGKPAPGTGSLPASLDDVIQDVMRAIKDGEKLPDGTPVEVMTKEEMQRLADDWKGTVVEAAVLAKRKGQLSASFSHLVDALLTPKIPWTERLRRFIQNDIVIDYTYRRPSRRSAALGNYYPSILKESLDIVLHLDTSGSMSGPPVQICLDQMYQILGAYENVKADFLMGDSRLQEHRTLSRRERVDVRKLALKGFGGTSHKFVVDWILDNKPNAKVLVTLTDGCSDIEEQFRRLPPRCHKIILIPEKCGYVTSLGEYGEVIMVDYQVTQANN